MNTMAATVVALLKKVDAPELPNRVWLEPPPKAAPMSAPLPVYHMNNYQQDGHWLSSFIRLSIVKKNQLAERFGVQAGTADQGAVNIGHLHEGPDVVRLDAPSVKDANGIGKRFSKQRIEQRPDKLMRLLSLFAGGGFSSADGPYRFVGDNQTARSSET
jgi:hypothetical protein